MALGLFQSGSIQQKYLEALIAARAPENLTLEFKREPYSNNDSGKGEFLKDVSGLANIAGGWLLLGIDEESGAAAAIVPIADGDPDGMKQRLNNLILHGVEPRITGISFTVISVAGGYVLAIRVPSSIAAPHRVISLGRNKYYIQSTSDLVCSQTMGAPMSQLTLLIGYLNEA